MYIYILNHYIYILNQYELNMKQFMKLYMLDWMIGSYGFPTYSNRLY